MKHIRTAELHPRSGEELFLN